MARRRPARLARSPAPAVAAVPAEEPFRPELAREDYAADQGARTFDRMTHAMLARATGGISPIALTLAWTDWAANLALSPGKAAELIAKAQRDAFGFPLYAMHRLAGQQREPYIEPLSQDRRFTNPAWQELPFALYEQGFLLTQRWWQAATTGVSGVSRHHEQVVSFCARQLLDIFSPSNFPATNPELLEATRREGGLNLLRGAQNFLEDRERQLFGRRAAADTRFRPGIEVAATPGQVVFRNRLMELIQYAPADGKVQADPLLVVPAWIMKYYILDLSPHNSLVRYLVGEGHTVFMISWRNPGAEDRDLGLEDYRLAFMTALEAVNAIVPKRRVHALGYCLGGTLLSIAAAAMARAGDDRLASIGLLAAQVDFTDAGDLTLFIDASQVAWLEDLMWSQGYLDTRQMAGAFTLLRSTDLLWSRLIHDYFLGQREDKNDLMAWNADATRMPYRMHAEYLNRLFLENQLAQGKFEVEGRPVALTDIRAPVFAVATARDHVAPWRSVYKLRLFLDSDITFLLTSGGHNGGIVTPPGHPRRIYQVAELGEKERYRDPDRWRLETPVRQGSWWPQYERWLAARSGPRVAPPPLARPQSGYPALGPAPGTYVHQE